MRMTNAVLNTAIMLRQAEWLWQKFEAFGHQQQLELQQLQQELLQLQEHGKPLEDNQTHAHNWD